MMACLIRITWPARLLEKDTLPEWSKGVDSSSTSASCVGSNPTAVILLPDPCSPAGKCLEYRTMFSATFANHFGRAIAS